MYFYDYIKVLNQSDLNYYLYIHAKHTKQNDHICTIIYRNLEGRNCFRFSAFYLISAFSQAKNRLLDEES